MRHRILSLALLGLALLAGGGLWWAARPGGSAERAAVRPTQVDQVVRAEDVAAEIAETAELSGALDAPEALAPSAEADAKPARVAVPMEPERDLEGPLWVEGRVVLPAGMPPDERVQVVFWRSRLGRPQAVEAEVGPDGAFRVPFERGTKSGRFELKARYLHLDDPDDRPRVRLGTDTTVVLEARLGGVLSGRVLPPPGVPNGGQELIGRSVEVSGWRQAADGSWSSLRRSVDLDASLSFVFAGLPSDLEYQLSCDPEVYELCIADKLSVPAGGATEKNLQMQACVTISGRVIDAAGAPVAGAAVRARAQAQRRYSQTDASGAFILRGVSPGAITLAATAKGFLPLEVGLGSVGRGSVRSDLVLQLDAGMSISGRVLWPEGTAAEGALVIAQPLRSGHIKEGDGTVTDASGHFTITGLDAGLHRIVASAMRKEQARVPSKVLGRERLKPLRRSLRAVQSGIESGATGIQLELSEGETIHGVVVDDSGAPVEEFRVSVSGDERTGGRAVDSDRRSRDFTDAAGAFAFTGFAPGAYELRVKASGFLDSPAIELELPLASPLAPIRLSRTAR